MYPELPQDMGEIWHHWVRSVWPQKMGSARLAVLWPRLAKVTIDKVKNVFWLKVIFFKTSIQINFIFVVSNGQSDIAAFCRIFRAFWQINSTASWPTVPPPFMRCFFVRKIPTLEPDVGLKFFKKGKCSELNFRKFWPGSRHLRPFPDRPDPISSLTELLSTHPRNKFLSNPQSL